MKKHPDGKNPVFMRFLTVLDGFMTVYDGLKPIRQPITPVNTGILTE